jgi:hypothetical protein
MKRHLVILVLSVLLIVSVAFNIWSLVSAVSERPASDKYASEPAPDKVFAFFVGNPPLNEAAPDSIWIFHQSKNSTELITLADSTLGYSMGYDSRGFEIDYGAKFGSPNFILYTVYFTMQQPQKVACPLNITKSTSGKLVYDSNY